MKIKNNIIKVLLAFVLIMNSSYGYIQTKAIDNDAIEKSETMVKVNDIYMYIPYKESNINIISNKKNNSEEELYIMDKLTNKQIRKITSKIINKPAENQGYQFKKSLSNNRYKQIISQDINVGDSAFITLSAIIEIYSYSSFRQINSIENARSDGFGNGYETQSTSAFAYLDNTPGTKATVTGHTIIAKKYTGSASVGLNQDLILAGFKLSAGISGTSFIRKTCDESMTYSLYSY